MLTFEDEPVKADIPPRIDPRYQVGTPDAAVHQAAQYQHSAVVIDIQVTDETVVAGSANRRVSAQRCGDRYSGDRGNGCRQCQPARIG